MRQTQDRVIKRTQDRLHFAAFDTQGQQISVPCAAHLDDGVRFIDDLLSVPTDLVRRATRDEMCSLPFII